MGRKPVAVSWIATHAVAAGLGVAVWWAVKPEAEGKTDGKGEETVDFRSGTRRTERTRSGLSGDELLTRMTGKDGREKIAEEEERPRGTKGRTERLLGSVERISKLADSVEPADDVAGAAREAMEKLREEMKNPGKDWDDVYGMAQARLMHWLREDPRAALAFDFRSYDGGGRLNDVFTAAVKEAGVMGAADWLGVSPAGDTELRKSLASLAGIGGDAEMVRVLKGKVSAGRWGDMRSHMAGYWPMEKADAFLEVVKEEKASLALTIFARENGEQGLEWLREKMASEEMDPDLKAGLLKRQEYRDLYYWNPGLPYEERFAALVEASPNQSQEGIKFTIGMRDVLGVLNKGRDWRYAFRNGAVGFDEVYAAVAAELPSLASSAPEAIRNHLVKELAEDNGAAVMEKLSELPEEERWQAAIKPARSMFYSVNPQDLYDYLQHIPADAGGESVWEQRLQAWTNQTGWNRSRFDTAYVKWVRDLPEGLDREMAAFALVKNGKDVELAEELRAEVRDPKLVQRLEGGR